MENCSSCYLEERVKTLLTPWVTKSFPWDQSPEYLSEVVNGTKENLPCSSQSTESDYDTNSQFTCHHSTSPQNPMSLYNRNSYSHSRPCNHGYYRLCRVCNNSNLIASFLACRHCIDMTVIVSAAFVDVHTLNISVDMHLVLPLPVVPFPLGLIPITTRIRLIMNLKI